MKFLRIIPVILVWGRHVIQAVMVMEGVIRGNQTGAQKKAAVLAVLSGIARETKLPWGPAVVEILADLIDITVKALNLRGMLAGGEMPTEIAATIALVNNTEAPPNLSKVIEQDPALQAFLAKLSR
jgi:hypothetical protein